MSRTIKRKILLIAFLNFILATNLFAKITIEVQPNTYYTNIETSEAPLLYSKIRAYQDGKFIELNIKDILIHENNIDAFIPQKISGPINGWQKVEWYPADIYSIDTVYQAQLIVTKDGESGNSFLQGILEKFTYFQIKDQNNQSIDDINFNDMYRIIKPIDEPFIYPVYFSMSWLNPHIQNNVIIDSITTTNPAFKIGKKIHASGFVNKYPFDNYPSSLNISETYLFEVEFVPENRDAYHDVVTIYYNNHMKKSIPVFASFPHFEKDTILHLIYPNGNENFTPCQEVEIQWENYAKNTPVKVEYSNNGGKTWNYAGKSNDDFFLWTVPSYITNEAKIRISQDLQETKTVVVRGLPGVITQINYNSDGQNLLAIEKKGKIAEFNLYADPSPKITKTWNCNTGNDFIITTVAVDYASGDSLILAAYNTVNMSQEFLTKLAFFSTTGDTLPKKIITLPNKFYARKMIVSKNKNFVTLVPQDYNPNLYILNPINGEIINSIIMEYPIMDITENSKEKELYVLLYNGEIIVYNIDDITKFKEIKRIDFSLYKLPILMGNSPNNRLLTFGYNKFGSNTINYVFDIQKGHIVKNVKVGSSNTIIHSFSPESRHLVVGSKSIPQIALIDLTKIRNEKSELTGHYGGSLTDVKFAPDAHSMASSSNNPNNDIMFRTFSFPDEDMNDRLFNIVPVDITTPIQNIAPAYLGTENHVFINNICNNGITELSYKSLKLVNNKHFKFIENYKNTDTLLPGDCSTIELVYFPLDTGKITDSLVFKICDVKYYVPLITYSYPRNISYSLDSIDFGEVCIGEEEKINVRVSNNDPVPLIIDRSRFEGDDEKHFQRDVFGDIILQANSSTNINLSFLPLDLGNKTVQWLMFHSLQSKLVEEIKLKGKGIGTFVETSHQNLLFIPEISTRILKIINVGQTPIFFESVDFETDGYYQVVTTLPVTIDSYDTLELEIRKVKHHDKLLTMSINATPCLVQKYIYLGDYDGFSKISIANVVADPQKKVTIPLQMINSDVSAKYDGIRFFEADIKVNSKLFLPLEISTIYDNAEIINNYENNGERTFTIRVEGNFSNESEIAKITGIPGTADTNYSKIIFNNNSKFFGSAVSVSTNDGSIKINGRVKDRKIIRKGDNLKLLSLSPNPAVEYINIVFESKDIKDCDVFLIDNMGNIIMESCFNDLEIGINERILLLNNLPTSSYLLKIEKDGNFDDINFTIIK